jgi:hypothetical protein
LESLLTGLAVKQGNTLALCQSVALNSLGWFTCPRMAYLWVGFWGEAFRRKRTGTRKKPASKPKPGAIMPTAAMTASINKPVKILIFMLVGLVFGILLQSITSANVQVECLQNATEMLKKTIVQEI